MMLVRVVRFTICGLIVALACSRAPGLVGPSEACSVRGGTSARRVELRQACSDVRRRFNELFAAPPPAGTISIVDSVPWRATWSGRSWSLGWPGDSWWELATSSVGDVTELGMDVIQAHEIGHMVVLSFLDRSPQPGEYGTDLPDWFEEATATWMEPASSKDGQLRRARLLASEGPRIDSILTMRNPVPRTDSIAFAANSVRGPCTGICGGHRPNETRVIRFFLYKNGRTETDTTYGEVPEPPLYLREFYSLSHAVLVFVAETGGRVALDSLVHRLHVRHPHAQLLNGLPGLPADPTSLQQRWIEWLGAPPGTATGRRTRPGGSSARTALYALLLLVAD